jgi:hypothetical protein
MADNDLERLKSDLATIREAAGLELRFGWEDVWINIAAAPAGLTAFVWALFFDGRAANWGFLPLVALAVVWGVWVRGKYRRSTGRSAVRRREYSASLILALVLAILLAGYVYWAKHMGLGMTSVRAIAFVMVGLALLAVVILDTRRVDALPWAIWVLLAGLVIPWVGLSAQAITALAIAIAGPSCAAIQVCQLRMSRRTDAAH